MYMCIRNIENCVGYFPYLVCFFVYIKLLCVVLSLFEFSVPRIIYHKYLVCVNACAGVCVCVNGWVGVGVCVCVW
jgi:hypothetical protein